MNATAHLTPATCDVTVTRVFDAPRELVFSAWTQPHHLARWWGPQQCTNPVCELDTRVAGRITVHTRSRDGRMFLMTGSFEQVVAPERLVIVVVATDAEGGPLLEGRITAEFEAHGRKTRVTVREQAMALAPAAVPIVERMELNWVESLVRLAGVITPAA